MNFLTVSPDLAIIEADEILLKRDLEELGIDCHMLPFRNNYAFGGSFHCTTRDIRRDNRKEKLL